MKHSTELTRCIRDYDVDGFMKLTKHINPDFAPENSYQAAAQIHIARTKMKSVPVKLRMYSHCWLRDEDMITASQLPDHLRPRAERLYPVGAKVVGISSQRFIGGRKTAFNLAIQNVMEEAVLETYADGHSHQPQIVKARMLEKRADFKKRA